VDDENSQNPAVMEEAARGQPPVGTEYYVERSGGPLLVKKQVVLTGDRLTDAQPGFDNQTHEPAVHLTLDSAGARIFKDVTRGNVGKRMAILLIEKGKGEVITAPVIRTEIGGGRVQISGRMSTVEANDVALLSMLQATLTLPGIAAIALTLGMAIDANVLINERIREELRNGATPQAAIAAGYERAFGTILDSNVTSLIAGLALLIFGSGPVRGFAVVHCLGILTSMFSSVVVSRGIVNLVYGSRRKLAKLSIGNVAWK
jgi:preprotein translocase subunit SecD